MTRVLSSFAALSLALGTGSSVLQAQTVAIVGGRVHTVSGSVIENGVVVMQDGRIIAVGAAGSVTVPSGAQRVDATGKIVTPGLIDVATQIGLTEVGSLPDTHDESMDGDPIRAAFRIRDGLNPRSIVIPVTRAGGVTTVAATPTGGLISGQSAVIDLVGQNVRDQLIDGPGALYASLDPSSADAVGGARGATVLRLREFFDDARFYGARLDAYDGGQSRHLAASRLDLAAGLAALRGEIRFVIRASRASDIQTALELSDELGVSVTIEGAEEAWMVADDLAAAGVPVIIQPLSNLPLQFDRLGTRYDNAAFLQDAGVTVVISTFDTHNARNLRQEAGNAVRFGMSWEAALRAVTFAPAWVLGIDASHGSLEPGKAANVVVWSGDPFELSTAVEHVFIRGREVDLDTRHRRLLERYRNLDDGRAGYRGRR